MSKYVVTGGMGFIGSHLVDTLSKEDGAHVIVLDNLTHNAITPEELCADKKNVEYYWLDIRDHNIREIIRGADVVFHLAAQINIDNSIINPNDTIDINVNGTLNVLETCRIYKVPKVVFASSSEIYGTALTDKMDESHPLDPQSPYGATKVFGDRLCHAYNEAYGMNIAILRNFNVFGPRQRYTRAGDCYGAVIGIFTDLILRGKSPIIFGDGEQRRDYQYVSDAVDGYLLCVEKDIIGPVVVGTGVDISINDIALTLIDICGKKGEIEPIHADARPGEVRRLCADTTLARSYGFRSHTDLYNGLKAYVEWFKANVHS